MPVILQLRQSTGGSKSCVQINIPVPHKTCYKLVLFCFKQYAHLQGGKLNVTVAYSFDII